MSSRKLFLDSLVRARRNNENIDQLFQKFEKSRSSHRPTIIKGVHRGNFVRIKIPPKQGITTVPKIPSPVGPALKPFKSVPLPPPQSVVAQATAAGEQARQQGENVRNYFEWLYRWWKENWSIMTMNIGSLCTLMAFTRSDVLELRTLSVSGSVCFVVYTLATAPIKWLTVGWTSLFAAVNTYKIVQIINERHSHVHMTEEQEECYTKFFMPNGITPKQFERIEKNAERVSIKRNEPLIKQGEPMEFVYLVTEGSTRASILGRYLTAASTAPMSKEVKESGNAGAWVGEMAFLESVWGKDDSDAANAPPTNASSTTSYAMYTVIAKEDCVVWRWSHEEMAELMDMSADMNAVLTRAMTSAIVGKVISFTTSRQSARPSWQTFLDGWKHAPVQVKIKEEFDDAEDDVDTDSVDEEVDENSEGYPKEGSPDATKDCPA